MLRNLQILQGAAIQANDGPIGHIKDFYFDDQSWVIRYLVVETGNWLSSRRVLVSPMSISHADWSKKLLAVSITREQVKNSPDIDTQKPVSRQHEVALLDYYAYPIYWGSAGLWGAMDEPNLVMPDFVSSPSVIAPQADSLHLETPLAPHHGSDPHLRSSETLRSYSVQASDGEIGHVQSLLVDDQTWAIRYLIVATSNWWLGHQVLVSAQWVADISWSERDVSLRLTQQAIRDCEPYDPATTPDRSAETRIHEHYGYTGYWMNPQKLRGFPLLPATPIVPAKPAP